MKGSEVHIVVVGGGLAGFVSSILLARYGHEVVLVEKKVYPFHRVCGEYISNEVRDFLKRSNLLPTSIEFPSISKFVFSDTEGQLTSIPLDLGGFGLSRYVLDEWLVSQAKQAGVLVKAGVSVSDVQFIEAEDRFQIKLSNAETLISTHVIGAFGKRSVLDKVLDRPFMKQRSPYIGVKYHVLADEAREMVALHNFNGGYCGINAIENGKFNLCYLGSRDQLREFGSIPEMEQEVLWKNPVLKRIFQSSQFLFDKPEVINEINFEFKSPVENHILMVGDAAGLITPLCGNGMAIAIRAGKMAAEAVHSETNRREIEQRYARTWNEEFKTRLWVGRKVQHLFGSGRSSGFARRLIQHVPAVAQKVVKFTHGRPF